MARAPFTPGQLKSNWAWDDADLPEPPSEDEIKEVEERSKRVLQRSLSNFSQRNGQDNLAFDSAV